MFHQNNGGFIQIIVIIVLIIVIISLLGISLKEIFNRLSANPEVAENFKFIKDWIAGVFNKYLSSSVGAVFNYMKDIFISSLKSIKPSSTAPIQTDTQQQPATQ